MRNNIACNTNCKYRTAATLHTLETLNEVGGGGGGDKGMQIIIEFIR